VHFNKLPSDNWPGIAPAFFFEGIDGLAGLSGAEPESGKTPPIEAQFSQNLNQKNLSKIKINLKRFTKKWVRAGKVGLRAAGGGCLLDSNCS
jgi:hypothetical protein